MANLPQSLSVNAPFGGPSTSAPVAGAPASKDRKMASAEHLVLDLSNPELRENALLELSKVPNYHYLILSFLISSSINTGFLFVLCAERKVLAIRVSVFLGHLLQFRTNSWIDITYVYLTALCLVAG